MAIFRLYADILDYLYRNPDDMHGGSLEELRHAIRISPIMEHARPL